MNNKIIEIIDLYKTMINDKDDYKYLININSRYPIIENITDFESLTIRYCDFDIELRAKITTDFWMGSRSCSILEYWIETNTTRYKTALFKDISDANILFNKLKKQNNIKEIIE